MIIEAESRATDTLTGERHTFDALAEALIKEVRKRCLKGPMWSG